MAVRTMTERPQPTALSKAKPSWPRKTRARLSWCMSHQSGQENNVVNIVTSTATNEQGQQIIIIDNLDQHSPELQREIMNALLADHNIVPISQ